MPGRPPQRDGAWLCPPAPCGAKNHGFTLTCTLNLPGATRTRAARTIAPSATARAVPRTAWTKAPSARAGTTARPSPRPRPSPLAPQAGRPNRGNPLAVGCLPLQVQHLDVRLALLRRLLRLRPVHVLDLVERQHVHQSLHGVQRLRQLQQRLRRELVQRRHLAVQRLGHRRRRLDALHLRCAWLGLGLGLGSGAAPLARRTPKELVASGLRSI